MSHDAPPPSTRLAAPPRRGALLLAGRGAVPAAPGPRRTAPPARPPLGGDRHAHLEGLHQRLVDLREPGPEPHRRGAGDRVARPRLQRPRRPQRPRHRRRLHLPRRRHLRPRHRRHLVHFGGSFTIGNTSFGTSGSASSNRHLTSRAATARCIGDVGWSICGADCDDGIQTPQRRHGRDPARRRPEDVAGHVTATVTPDFPARTRRRQRRPPPVPGHPPRRARPAAPPFFVTATTGQNTHQGPAPISLVFDYTSRPPRRRATTTSTTSTLDVHARTSTSTSHVARARPRTTSTSTSTTTTVAPAPTDDIEDGTLDWGVKASFRSLHHRHRSPRARPRRATAPPPTPTAPTGSRSAATGAYEGADDLAAGFDGSVHFTGHDGALDLDDLRPPGERRR